MPETEDNKADSTSLVYALRYIATSEGGIWQIRRGADIEEVNSLRHLQHRAGMEEYAHRALAIPATWIHMQAEE